jgi:hypothetical protein
LVFAPPTFYSVVFFVAAILIFVFVTYSVCLYLLKEKQEAGIFASVFVFFMLWYFDVYYLLFNIQFIKEFVSAFLFQKFHVVLINAIALFSFCIYFFLKRTKRKFILLNRYLNIVFFLFFLIELYKISFERRFGVTLQNKINSQNIHLQTNKDSAKDIYFIVMDCYTSSSSLKKHWNYDNNDFEEYLKSKKFLIAENSRANYNSTPFCISSELNMSYLNLENYDQAQKVQMSKVYDLVKNSAAVQILSANGYAIKNYSLFDLLNTTAFYQDPFYHKTNLFDRTFFFFITERLHITHEHQSLINLGNSNLDILSQINSLQKEKSPTFYYIHLMMPHFPYFFDENGTKMPDPYVLSEEQNEEKYLKQLKYTNNLITEAVGKILEKSKNQPIIIIQGDHGFRDLQNLGFEEQIKESKTIFNAYFFPDKNPEKNMSCDSISPVNSFRIIFNNYFGATLPLLDYKFCNTEIKEKQKL